MATEAESLEPTMLDSEPGSAKDAVPLRAEPVALAERVAAVDVLRGFALLGILTMNIVSFAWGDHVYGNPKLGGGFEGANRAVWIVNHMVFAAKMMTLFTMLFGAGLVLMGERADARGARLRGVYYRRILWLLAIGLVHAYLIWSGDVLVFYAECGLWLYLFRRKTPRTLLILGVAFIILLLPLAYGFYAGFKALAHRAERLQAEAKAGRTLGRIERELAAAAPELAEAVDFRDNPSKEKKDLAEERKANLGSYADVVRHRAPDLVWEQLLGIPLGLFGIGGRMLLGMGLMKLGVFGAARSRRFYLGLAAFGYGLGLPLVAADTWLLIRDGFSNMAMLRSGLVLNYFGSQLVALGHVAALMLVVRAGALTWLTDRLAAVGRMALSNYLTHSIVCTTLFYGYGFSLFAQVPRVGLAGIVLAIWVAQLAYSPIWLAHFRFGPAEWLWRSLTYWRIQPLRRPRAMAVA